MEEAVLVLRMVRQVAKLSSMEVEEADRPFKSHRAQTQSQQEAVEEGVKRAMETRILPLADVQAAE